MENASDALIMATNFLLFLIALTVCISSFSMLRQGVDNILNETEVVSLVKDDELYINYIDSKNNNAVRIVGAETVVSSMVRSIKENYVVYIKLKNYDGIFSDTDTNAVNPYQAQKDLIIATKENPTGEKVISAGETIIKTTIGNGTNQNINAKLKNGFFEKLKNKEFYEYLGEYVNDTDNINIEEKTVYRLITYIEK